MDNVLSVRANTKENVIWIPYLKSIEKLFKTKPIYEIKYNGGVMELDLNSHSVLMLYGKTDAVLPMEFLNDLSETKTILLVHRRNLTTNYAMIPESHIVTTAILTKQIVYRENAKKRVYIAKTLINSRLKSMEWIIPISDTTYKNLKAANTIEKVRSIEAAITKRYWRKFYLKLGTPNDVRRSDSEINKALNAGLFFLNGLVLRWVLLHRLSSSHGYLHVNTNMSALVYDLMEPYRYIVEKAVFETVDDLDGSIQRLKELLEEEIYCPKLRQYMTRKNLIHGGVLALRSYLTESKSLVIPNEGSKVTGGRKIKISYQIPGAKDAITRYVPKADFTPIST